MSRCRKAVEASARLTRNQSGLADDPSAFPSGLLHSPVRKSAFSLRGTVVVCRSRRRRTEQRHTLRCAPSMISRRDRPPFPYEKETMSADSPGPCHVSVLPAEVLEYLVPAAGQIVVDATLGGGGHARLLAERLVPLTPTPLPLKGERGRGEGDGRLIALDRDPAMIELARPRLEGLPVTFVQASFDQLRQVLDNLKVEAVDGVLADLGICSDQLDDPAGFSFQQDTPLDMRMNPHVGESAATPPAAAGEEELADLFYEYGEERFSRRIARRIVDTRQRQPLTTTGQLADLVRRCYPRPTGRRRQGIDPATRRLPGPAHCRE